MYEIPFVRLIIPFGAGILISSHFSFEVPIYHCLILGGILFPLYISIRQILMSLSLLDGLLISILFCLLGFMRTEAIKQDLESSNLFEVQGKQIKFLASVLEQPTTNPWIKIKAQVKWIVNDHSQPIVCGDKVILYLESQESGDSVQIGDSIIGMVRIDQVSDTRNPGEFNYKKFLYYQGIQFQGFVRKSNWYRIPLLEGLPFSRIQAEKSAMICWVY